MNRRQFTSAFAFLLLLASSSSSAPPKKLLLLAQGPDGHPPQTHEYMAGLRILEKCLSKQPGLEVTLIKADSPWREGPELLSAADGVVLYLSEGARWIAADEQRRDAFAQLAARGGGIVALHWALGTREAKPIADYLKLVGGCHGGPDRKYKEIEENLLVVDTHHPIATGVRSVRIQEEFYYRLKFVRPEGSVHPILQVPIDGEKETVAWSWERPMGGRSFGFTGLHFHKNWRLESYRRLVAQAVLWTLKLPIPKGGVAVDVGEEDLKLK